MIGDRKRRRCYSPGRIPADNQQPHPGNHPCRGALVDGRRMIETQSPGPKSFAAGRFPGLQLLGGAGPSRQ